MKLYDAFKNSAKGNQFEKVYLKEKYQDEFDELHNQPERSKREDDHIEDKLDMIDAVL